MGKVCNTCDELKPISQYRKRTHFAWDNKCKSCDHKSDASRLRSCPKRKVANIISSKRHHCKTHGIDFNLTRQWYQEKIDAGICEVLGIPIYLNTDEGNTAGQYEAQIDRINPKHGYTMNNCRVVCRWFNIAKGELPDSEAIRLARLILSSPELNQPAKQPKQDENRTNRAPKRSTANAQQNPHHFPVAKGWPAYDCMQ